jgi:hypothetical protein
MAGLQQINEPVPASARGDLLANTPDEIGTEFAGTSCHASTLLPAQPRTGTACQPAQPMGSQRGATAQAGQRVGGTALATAGLVIATLGLLLTVLLVL